MKGKKNKKNLVLNKKTIANLKNQEMTQMVGGKRVTVPLNQCVPDYTDHPRWTCEYRVCL